MADNNVIDSLELKVRSDANTAIANLGKLQTQLRHTAKSIGTLQSAINGLGKVDTTFQNLGKINVNGLAAAITQLERLSKIDLKGVAGKKINLDVSVTGASEAVREIESAKRAVNSVDSKKYADKLAKMFNIKDANALKTLRTQFKDTLSGLGEGDFRVDNKAIFGVLINEGEVARSTLDSQIAHMQNRYKEFLDYVNGRKFYIEDKMYFSKTSQMDEFLDGTAQYFTRNINKGTELNSIWEELTSTAGGFKDVFDSVTKGDEFFADTLTRPMEQATRLRDTIIRVKEAMENLPVSSLSKTEKESALVQPVKDIMGAMARDYDKTFKDNMYESMKKIPLQVVLDDESITTQIQKAIDKAKDKTYEFPIKLQLGKQNIQYQVADAIKGIDVRSLSEMGDKIKELATSLTQMSEANPKDNGMSTFVNSIKRLAEVDMSKFNGEAITNTLGAIKEMKDVGDISTSITRLVQSLARLANAGYKTKAVASALPSLGAAISRVASGLTSSGGLPSEMLAFVSGLGHLANAGAKTMDTAINLKALGDSLKAFIGDMQSVPDVSDSVIRMTEALGQLAANGGKVGTAARNVNKSLQKTGDGSQVAYTRLSAIVSIMRDLLSVFEKAGGVIKRGALKIISALRNLKKESNGLQTATQSIKNMIGAMIGFRGITGLGNTIKETVMLGADITEIDHIVESVFGNMSGVVDKWAKDAIENFGIAEHSAKQYAGTLSSMFQASNIGYMDAGKMSMDLVGLAGDLSAFYNIDTETAYNKIRSGMAGMVRPLRDLGIDLTAATLEEYRLAQGIETSYSQMSQAEKVMLRYKYLMSVTTTQQNDFQRTNLSLANSLRTLKAYAQAVQTQVGVGLASAIRHVVVWLNQLMKYILKAATAFATFMQTIFGKYKGGASGIAMEGLGDAADYADDLGNAADGAADGLGSAADSARQLKKDLSVLPFDELNQLNKDREETASGTGSGGSGGGAAGGGGVIDGLLDWGDLLENSEAGKLPDEISAWAQRIKNAFEHGQWNTLGQIVAKGINEGLQKVYDILDPEKIRQKVDPWINAFTTSFNSVVKWLDFDLLGRTIGRGINNVVHIINQTIEGIDFNQLGQRLADGVRGIFAEVDFGEAGNLIGNKLMIVWNTLNGFVHNFPWEDLGTNIANVLNGVFEKVNFTTIADTLATGLNGAFTALGKFTEDFKWDDLVDNIAGGISTFISEFNWKENGEKLGNFLSHLCDALIDVIDTVDWEALGQGIADFLQQLPWGKILKVVATAITTALGGLLEGLATTPAGQFATAVINGLIAFKIGGKLLPFVNNIGKAITGDSSFSIIHFALTKFLKKGVTEAAASETVTTAAETAGKTVVKSFTGGLSGLGTVAAEFGIVTLAVGGTVAAIYGLTRWVDKLQGGNGKITESGEALEAYIERIGESGQLSSQQVDTLWKEIEDMETAGYSTADMIDHVRSRLDEWKVSTDSQYGALQTLNSEGTTSKNIIDEMAQSYASTGDASAKYSSDVDEAFELVKKALYDARDATGDYSGRYDEVVRQLTESQGTFHTTQDVINATSAIMESVGLSTDDLGTDFDELADKAEQDAQRVSTASETMRSGIATGFEGAGGAVDKYVGNAAQRVQQNIHDLASAATATTDYKNTAESNMSSASASTDSWSKQVSTKLNEYKRGLGEASVSTADFSSKSGSELSRNDAAWGSWNLSTVASMTKMGMQTAKTIQLSQTMATNMISHTNSISGAYTNMTNAIVASVANMRSGIESSFAGIGNSVANAMNEVYRMLMSQTLEMWRMGQNLGQSLANGFSTIHIPTPYIWVSAYQMHDLGNGGYMYTPRFSAGWYRSGGLFKGGDGQVIGIAEDNRDEAVLPLEDRRAMSRIGSAIADAGGTGSGMSDDMMDRLATRIAEVILATQDNREQPMNYVELKVEEEVLARAVTRGQQRLDYRNNPTPQMA